MNDDRTLIIAVTSVISLAGLTSLLAFSYRIDRLISEKEVVDTQIKKENNHVNSYPKEIRGELTSRIMSFFGDEGFRKIQNGLIIVSYISVCLK